MTVTVNSAEYKSRVGLDSLYVAEVTEDSATAYTADTPQYFAPAAGANQKPVTATQTQYADDQPFDILNSEGETDIELDVTGIPSEMLALITGKTFDAGTGRVWDAGGTPPFMALSFRSQKSNGEYRYYQYLKGKFDVPAEEAATKMDKPDPKTTKIVYKAVKTIYKFNLGSTTESVKRVFGDTDTTNFSETGWFTTVQTPAYSAPSALALSSSVPTDGATGINVTADITLTFNNALRSDALTHITLLKASDASVIACAKSIDAALKVVTINPNASLSASTDYIVSYLVDDIYGQNLIGAINFTTA